MKEGRILAEDKPRFPFLLGTKFELSWRTLFKYRTCRDHVSAYGFLLGRRKNSDLESTLWYFCC
jgi:hypothetical protein